MRRTETPRQKPWQRREADLSDVLSAWAGLVLKIALVATAVAYGYYVWAIVGGYLARPVNVNPLILSNLAIMGRALVVASALATITLLYLTFDEVAWAVLAGLVGAGFLFGTPFLIAAYAQGGQTESVGVVASYTKWAGQVVLILVVARVLLEIGMYVAAGPKEKPEEKVEAEKVKRAGAITAKLWARCWDMPYCHDAVRDTCPAYVDHKTCWKFGYGCMCNPKLIEALIRASTGGRTTTKRAEGEYLRSDLEADVALSSAQRTIPCVKCPIYIEHQRQKYRIVNPIVIALTLAGLIFGYAPIMGVYRRFLQVLSNLAARFTLTDQIDPRQWFYYLDSPAVRIFFYVIMGTIFMAYVLKSVEWLVLNKKVV